MTQVCYGMFLQFQLPSIFRFNNIAFYAVTDLGLMIVVVSGHVIVSKVKQLSVAGEDHKVKILKRAFDNSKYSVSQ